MLHLIKVNEIDIFNIDVLLLTEQYLGHLRVMEFDNLADAAEFLEMASTLLEIKTRMMLPTIDTGSERADEDDSDDPLKDLQARLIEYETFRNVSQFFEQSPQLGVEIQTNNEWQRLDRKYAGLVAPLRGDPVSVVMLYEQLLKDFVERKPDATVQAITHRVGVRETIDKMISLLDKVKFAMFQSFYKNFESRYELVVHILAVLEMSRWGQAKLYQEGLHSPLWVYRTDYDEDLLPVKRLQGAVQPSDEALGDQI